MQIAAALHGSDIPGLVCSPQLEQELLAVLQDLYRIRAGTEESPAAARNTSAPALRERTTGDRLTTFAPDGGHSSNAFMARATRGYRHPADRKRSQVFRQALRHCTKASGEPICSPKLTAALWRGLALDSAVRVHCSNAAHPHSPTTRSAELESSARSKPDVHESPRQRWRRAYKGVLS